MQLSGSIGSMASDALGLKDPNALYITMMKSRTIGEKLVTRFNLQEIYGREWQLLEVRPLKKLRQRTDIFTNKDGVIVIQVDDRDPQRAADLANAYIEEFNILLRTRVMTEAAARRQFFEVHSREEKDKLTDAQLLLDKTPTTSLDYLDAMRNFKYHEGVYEMLAKQFELAMLDEAKDLPMVEVLDKATKPEARSSPKRKQIVLLATLAGLILSVMWVFLSEVFKRQADDPEQAERMDELRRSFRWRRREKNAQGKA
jgi:uncharacterized protein involved in exopolysaccharide biosynthesis